MSIKGTAKRYARASLGAAAFLVPLFMTPLAHADAVTQEMDRARQAYLQGKFAEARQSLELAAQLVAEQKAKLLNGTLPPPFLGWTVDKAPMDGADTATSAGAMRTGNGMLGGITASHTYRKDAKSCSVTVTGDSPLLSVVAQFLANPTVAQASGAKMQRIGNQRAIITQDNEVQVLSANNYLVSVGGDCELADKIAYAGAVDYAKLATF